MSLSCCFVLEFKFFMQLGFDAFFLAGVGSL